MGRKDGRKEGRTDGRTEGRTDGRKDGRTVVTKVTGHFVYYVQTLVEDPLVREYVLVQVRRRVCV